MMSDEALLDLCRALVSALRSGLALSDAFGTLARSPRHRRLLAGAAGLTARGAALHEAFAAQGVFPPVFLALLRAGEESGKADEFLELYAGCLEVRVRFRRQAERMLIYPLFVLLLSGALFLLVSFKVVPLVLEPLLKAGASLPPQAFFFSALAEALYGSWYKLLAALSAAALALRYLLGSAPGRKARGLAGHFLPVYSFAVSEARFYYLYTMIGLLLKAGLRPGAMLELLKQFSQYDPVTGGRLGRAAVMLSSGKGFTESLAPIMQEDDRTAMEVAEKAGRLEDTVLARARLHYDRHLHRMEQLVKAFDLSILAVIALISFALILTAAWPAVSVISGSGDPLRSLGLSSPAAGEPEPAGSPGTLKALPLSPEQARTGSFNEKHGKETAEFIRLYGKAGAPDGGRAGNSARRKLKPAAPINKLQLKNTGPTPIQPTEIGGR